MIKAQHDTLLRCTTCGRTSRTSFASSLTEGWERCCGYTMRLESTTADIEASVRQVLREQGLVYGGWRRE
jgi:hypothetical protein